MLENAYYILTPGGQVSLEKLTEFSEFIDSLGAIPMVLSAEEARFYHSRRKPPSHIIASGSCKSCKRPGQRRGIHEDHCRRRIPRYYAYRLLLSRYVAAASAMENSRNISSVLDEYIRMLIQIRCSVDNREADNLYQMFASSRDYPRFH